MSGTGGGKHDRETARRRAWEDRTTGPLVVLGIGFLVAYATLVLAEALPPDRKSVV